MEGVRQPYIEKIVSKYCMKIKEMDRERSLVLDPQMQSKDEMTALIYVQWMNLGLVFVSSNITTMSQNKLEELTVN